MALLCDGKWDIFLCNCDECEQDHQDIVAVVSAVEQLFQELRHLDSELVTVRWFVG